MVVQGPFKYLYHENDKKISKQFVQAGQIQVMMAIC